MKISIRRLVCIALALCLLLPLMAGAQQEMRDEQGQPLYASSLCLHQDQLLIGSHNAVYGWRPGQPQARLLSQQQAQPAYALLLGDDTRLWGLDGEAWQLYPLLLAGDALSAGSPMHLQAPLLEDPLNQGLVPMSAVVRGDSLFMLFSPSGLGGWQGEVWAFDLHTGQGTQVPLPAPQWIAGGPDGRLLVLSHDYRAASDTMDAADDSPTVLSYDPASGQAQPLYPLQQPFDSRQGQPMIFWDAQARELLYTTQGMLYRRAQDGVEQPVARVPEVDSRAGALGALQVLAEGTLALISRGQAQTLSPQAQQQALATMPLQIYGNTDRGQHERVMQSLPGLSAQLLEPSGDEPSLLGQQLSSGASDIDVLHLHTDQDELQRMADKGYLLDLSGSEAIRAHVQRCYPLVRGPAPGGEAICLVPIAVHSTVYTYRPRLFEATGLAVPRSFADFTGFLQGWAQGGGDQHTAYLPLAEGQVRRSLVSQAVQLGLLAQAAQGEAPRFDSPLLRELLGLALDADVQALELAEGDYSFMNKPALIRRSNLSLPVLSMSASMGDEEWELPLLLEHAQGQPALLPVQVEYLAVYAASDNQQAAIQYVEGCLAALEHEARVMLYPDFDEPVMLPGIDEVVVRYDARIAQLDKDIAAAQGAQKTQLEEEREQARRTRQEQERMRWHLSPEMIALYRGMMEHAVVVTRQQSLLWRELSFRELMDRLQQGQLAVEQFIQEAQGRLRLMQLEAP